MHSRDHGLKRNDHENITRKVKMFPFLMAHAIIAISFVNTSQITYVHKVCGVTPMQYIHILPIPIKDRPKSLIGSHVYHLLKFRKKIY